MGFGNWIGLVLLTAFCFLLGGFLGGAVSAGFGSTAGAIVFLLIAFGAPWFTFRGLKSESTCDSCGKKWSLERDGYRDGEVTELHERNSAGELKLVHKWDRYQDWKCKNCGHETTHIAKITETV